MTTRLLKQMSIGEILDGSIAIFRRYFRTLIGIGIVCQGGPTVVYAYIELAGGPFQHPGLFFGWMILSAFGGLLAAGATLRAISQAYLGSEPRLEDSLSYALGKIAPLFTAGVAKYLVIMLGFMVFIIPGIIAALGYALVPQVVVLENLPSSVGALGRSWRLTKGFKGKVFLLAVVVYFLVYLPTNAAVFLATFMPGLTITFSLLGSLLYVVLFPIVSSAFTLLYYDLRLRKEAFDLELLSQQMGVMAEAS